MNTTKKNVVIVGFTKIEKNSISIPMMPEPYNSQKVHFVDSIKEAQKYQGYMLIIDNSKKTSIIELDKKYRNLFNKFEVVVIYNKSYKELHRHNNWTNISLIGTELFLEFTFLGMWDEYQEKKNKKIDNELLFNINKKKKIDLLYKYIKKYKSRSTSEIAKDLNLNERSIQRYLKDLNNIYHNIGYDYSLNEWYFIQ